MFNQTITEKSKVDDENPYWISFSDIMAGLLVIFILAALLLFMQLTQQQVEVDRKVKDIEKANKVRSELLGDIKEALEKEGIEVEISDNESVLRIPSSTLNFVSNHADIPPEKKDVVKKIGKALINAITTSDRGKYIDTVFVEGHTDSVPSDYKGVGNWLLSADRAVSIWRYWGAQKSTLRLWQLKNFRKENMFSVSGYAETRRVVEDDAPSPELKKKNRRIDLRFTMKQPKQCEYEEIFKVVVSC